MKLEVFTEQKESEKKIRLVLKEFGAGVAVEAVDETGKTVCNGMLVYFSNDGNMFRSKDVNPTLGFQLDTNGRIVLTEKL